MPTTTTRSRKAKTKVDRNAAAAEALKNAAPFLSNSQQPAPQATAQVAPLAPNSKTVSTDLNSGLPVVSPQEFAQRFEQLSGQERAAKLAQKRATVDFEYSKAQGIQAKAQVQDAKNLVTLEGVNLETQHLAAAQVQTQIAAAKVEAVNIDLQGERSMLPLAQDAWAIRAEKSSIDNAGERALLEPRREHWAAKLELAQAGLDQLRQQVHIKLTELQQPLDIEQID